MDTTEKQITIRMPKELLRKWLKALRSGKYQQAKSALCKETLAGSIGYCCLGVLEKVVEGDVERYSDGRSKELPSFEWLKAKNISFSSPDLFISSSPYLPSLCDRADIANDVGCSFAEIADAIEACAEGI